MAVGFWAEAALHGPLPQREKLPFMTHCLEGSSCLSQPMASGAAAAFHGPGPQGDKLPVALDDKLSVTVAKLVTMRPELLLHLGRCSLRSGVLVCSCLGKICKHNSFFSDQIKKENQGGTPLDVRLEASRMLLP